MKKLFTLISVFVFVAFARADLGFSGATIGGGSGGSGSYSGSFTGDGSGLTNLTGNFNNPFVVSSSYPTLTYGVTNPIFVVGLYNFPPFNNKLYAWKASGPYYTNSVNTNCLLFLSPSITAWEFSTNYPSTAGLGGVAFNNNGSQFPTNTAQVAQWYTDNSFGTIILPDTINLGTTNGIVTITTNISSNANSPLELSGYGSVLSDDASTYVVKVFDQGVSNGVPVYIGGFGDQKIDGGYTSTFVLNGGNSSAVSSIATIAVEYAADGGNLGNGYVLYKERFNTDANCFSSDGRTTMNQEEMVRFNGVPSIHRFVTGYGNTVFGHLIDGVFYFDQKAFVTVRDGSTNNSTDHVFPPFMLQHTLAAGPSTLPTIVTNGAFSVDGDRTYFDAHAVRFPIPQVQQTNITLSAATTFTWTFQYPYADTNYSISEMGTAAVVAPVLGAKTTTTVILTMTAFTGILNLIAIHQ